MSHATTCDGETVLIAFVTGDPDLDATTLRDRLPDQLVPERFRVVPALPTAANGKLDRRRLAQLAATVDSVAPQASSDFVTVGSVEILLAQIWTDLLGSGPRHAQEDLFDAGGHSIMAVQLIGRIQQATGISVPLRDILEHPTFHEIAAALTLMAPR